MIDLGLVLNGDRTIFTQANRTIQINGVISDHRRQLGPDGIRQWHQYRGQAGSQQPRQYLRGFRGSAKIFHPGQKLDNAGNASSLGTGNGTSLIKIGQQSFNVTLVYTGNTASSTNRPIQIGMSSTDNAHNGGALLKNNATDAAHALAFTANSFNTPTTQNQIITRKLTIGGSNTGNNTIAGVIQNNNGGTISLTKADAGTWIVTGNTTVSAGILVAAHANALGDTAAGTTVSSNATLAQFAAEWSGNLRVMASAA